MQNSGMTEMKSKQEEIQRAAIVTGATSLIGMALIRFLLSNRWKVLAIVRPGSDRIGELPVSEGLTVEERQLYELDKIENCHAHAMQYEVLYHIGWITDFSDGRNNLEGQLQNLRCNTEAVKLACRFGCRTFLSVGSQAECGKLTKPLSYLTAEQPICAYGYVKCKAYEETRKLCEDYGIRQLWPRLLSAYGYRDRGTTLIQSCLAACQRRDTIALTPCTQIWDFIHADDVAEALFRITETGRHGKKYTIASGIGIPLREYIYRIAKITDFPKLVDGIGKKVYAENQVMFLQGDISDTTVDTGFIPKIEFETGIRKIWEQRRKEQL